MFLMQDGMDLSFYIDCNGAKVDEKTILGLVSYFLLVHNLKILKKYFLKSFVKYDAILNVDLILMVGARMKASSCFFHVLLVFCHKRDSDVLIKVKLVQRVANV